MILTSHCDELQVNQSLQEIKPRKKLINSTQKKVRKRREEERSNRLKNKIKNKRKNNK